VKSARRPDAQSILSSGFAGQQKIIPSGSSRRQVYLPFYQTAFPNRFFYLYKKSGEYHYTILFRFLADQLTLDLKKKNSRNFHIIFNTFSL